MVEKFEIPAPATACPPPSECQTVEELYLFGLHIEQYRHATRRPEDYYLEGLRRDATDIRLNSAYGLLLLRCGQFEACKPYFKQAISKMTVKNPNPPATDPFFYLAIAELLTGNRIQAYDLFYKCLWSNEHKTARVITWGHSHMRKDVGNRRLALRSRVLHAARPIRGRACSLPFHSSG